MISLTTPDVNIRSGYLQAILQDKDLIKKLAVQLVGNQVEAHLEMISDAGTEEYSTFKEVDECIKGAAVSIEDYVEDALADFRTELFAALGQVKIETKAVLLKPDDDIDADVHVSIE